MKVMQFDDVIKKKFLLRKYFSSTVYMYSVIFLQFKWTLYWFMFKNTKYRRHERLFILILKLWGCFIIFFTV